MAVSGDAQSLCDGGWQRLRRMLERQAEFGDADHARFPADALARKIVRRSGTACLRVKGVQSCSAGRAASALADD